ncbi:MAG: ImmA/IrrE family metallo-endopeptidase [Pyrinomonadaceae bacterium]|nr:ImmA/IrrE family metallo-endopeptidase [Pyrinomonadaceae bacterium]
MEESTSLKYQTRLLFQSAAERRGIPLSDRAIDELVEKVRYLSLTGKRRPSRFQMISSPGSFRPTNQLAALLAERLRQLMTVSDAEPLFNLPVLLVKTFSVFTVPIEQSDISGGCAIIGGMPMLFVSKMGDVDGLFRCAHQIAHVLALSNQADTASLDASQNELGRAKSPYEHFADNVALNLLVPTRGLGIALRQTRKLLRATGPLGDVELLHVARIFGVSFLAVCKRCEQAKLLPEGGALALNRFLKEKFGSAERRAEELDLPPRLSASFSIASILAASHEVRETRSLEPAIGRQKHVHKDRY